MTAMLHPATAALRLFAYRFALGEGTDDLIESHLAACSDCQFWMAVFRATDPLLSGEDAPRMRALVKGAATAEKRGKAATLGTT
jgi:hypothetical protein